MMDDGEVVQMMARATLADDVAMQDAEAARKLPAAVACMGACSFAVLSMTGRPTLNCIARRHDYWY